jgi:hypothetical protein
MQFDYAHTVDLPEAQERLERLGAYLENRHGIGVKWIGHECTIAGKYLLVKIEGKMVVEAERVLFDGRDPGLLWRGKAIKYLKEKLEMYLDTSTPIDELPTQKV